MNKILANAISAREERNAALLDLKDSQAKFQSRVAADTERRRVRQAVRKCRANKRAATAVELTTAKRCRKKPSAAKPQVTKPAAHGNRHLPVNCCGRRKSHCICFTVGRGFNIAKSFKRRLFQPIPTRVAQSQIQTWRDTADMPAYMRQIGWNDRMRYAWLFPIAFTWRRCSNEQFWTALQDMKAVLQNQLPNFALMEEAMRAFQARDVSYHGGLFFSAGALTQYRFGSAEKPGTWITCDSASDFITREIIALKVMWHVARQLEPSFDALQRNPTRQCWKACTEDFLKALHRHTKGIFSDYALKIALDGVLLSQPCLEAVVSWWPMQCTAYKKELPKLYPACKQTNDDLFLAACHFHQSLKASFPRFYIHDSLAQTCWMKRCVT